MLFILPRAEWANDALRAALVQILRRLDKVFLKISKKPSIRVHRDNKLIFRILQIENFICFFFSGIRIGKRQLDY